MQIVGLSQCFNRQKRIKTGRKRAELKVTSLITRGYKTFS